MESSGKARLILGLLLLAFLAEFPVQSPAQVSTASINGTVKDSTGAVVPGVSVVLHNLATGVNLATSTNNAGYYVILNIPPGAYVLRVAKNGFKTVMRSNLRLVVNQASTYDFTLSLGSTRQMVNVQGSATILQTSTAELGTVVGAQEVNNLPLNGRNFTQLLQLTPGASPVNVSQSIGFQAVGEFDMPAVNGERNRSNLFLINGINDEGSVGNKYAVPPILDDIQEFKVDSHNDLVQFGGVTGGVVNVVTKSGTNHLHGAGWEYLRNSTFDSRDPFFPTVQPLRQNQFGANVGGPVLLPHYNGRDRTFFFGSYEGFRNHTPSQTVALIPTPGELQGNLSDLGVPIYNPFSTRPDPNNPGQYIRDVFPGGVIPESLLNPTMVKFAQAAFPTPNATGIAGANFSATSPLVTDQNEYSFRIDQQLGTKNSFWFRYSHISQPTTSFNPIGQSSSTTNYLAHTIGVNWTHTFGPTAVLQAQFGRTYATLNSLGSVAGVPASLTGNFAPTFACQFSGSMSCLLPSIALIGYSGIPGETVSNQGASDIWSGQANFSKLHGKHLFNMGFNLATNNIGETLLNNSVCFSPFQTANLASPGNSGSAIASFLLGVPDAGSRRDASGYEHGGWVDGFYLGDQWKATARLSVNMGIRWDFTIIPQWGQASNGSNESGSLNLNNGTFILRVPVSSCAQAGKAPCIPGTGLPAHVVVSPDGKIWHTDYKNFEPRLGLAYRLGSKTALRASGGIFYDNWETWSQLGQSISGTWPTIAQFIANNLNPNVPTATAENPLSAIGAGAFPAATPFSNVNWYKDPYIVDPYSEEWNFGIQRQLSPNTILAVDYVGSHSSRLNLGLYANTAVTPGPGPIAPRTPYPYITPTYYDRSTGRSSYNAFEFSLTKRFSKGLTYLVSYTWSKSMDIACSGYAATEGCATQNPYDVDADKSVSAYDLTHVLSASWVYELPFGKGMRFSSGSKLVDDVIGNWQVNGILSLHSGPPYTLGVSGDIANTGNNGSIGFYERLNQVGNPNLPNPTPAEWFNASAFQSPAAFTYGNLGRNTMRADWGKDLDFSLFRKFPIRETKYFEFRVEAFNATNTPIWGTPVDNFNSPNFGRVLSTANSPRQIQFALKFYY